MRKIVYISLLGVTVIGSIVSIARHNLYDLIITMILITSLVFYPKKKDEDDLDY